METAKLLDAQRQAILDGDTARAVELAEEAVRSGADLPACLDEGYVAGIREVGRLWEAGEYFLPELVQGADAMKAALAVIRPELVKRGTAPADGGGKVVLGTVRGDIHDIGKTLVATVLEANGVSVIDLGRDVEDELFVEHAREESVRVLGMSALLTTTMTGQKRVIEKLESEGLRGRVRVIVGGAPVTRSWAQGIGADGYASSAMDALAEVRRLLGEEA